MARGFDLGFDISAQKNVPKPSDDELLNHEDGWTASFGAGFERQSWVWGNEDLKEMNQALFFYDHNYDPALDDANRGYDPSEIAQAQSAEEAAHIRTQIDMEYDQLKLINASGWGLVGEITGAVVSPEALAGGTAPKLGWKGMMALEAALVGGAEAMLHNQQRTRTMQESLLNVGGAAAGAAIIGKAVDMWTVSKKLPPAYKADKSEMDDLGQGDDLGGSVGAEHRKSDINYNRLAGSSEEGVVARATEWFTDRFSIGPAARLARTESEQAGDMTGKLVDRSFYTKGMVEGESEGISIEAMVNQRKGEFVTILDDMKQLQAKSGMDWDTFDGEVWKAATNHGRHANPQVAETAQLIRERVLASRKQELIDTGMEIGSPTGANSYMPRVYDRTAITQNYAMIKQKLISHFERALRSEADSAAKVKAETRVTRVSAKLSKVQEKIKKLETAKGKKDTKQIQRLQRSEKRYSGLIEASKDPKLTRAAKVKKMKADRGAIQKKMTAFRKKHRVVKTGHEGMRKALKGKYDEYDKMRRDIADLDDKISATTKQRASAAVEAQQEAKGRYMNSADEMATNTIQNMLGGLPLGHGIGKPSAAMRRTLTMTDRELEQFLDTRASTVLTRYVDSIDPYILMRQNFGDESLTDQLGKVQDDYKLKIDEAATPAQKEKLRAQMNRDIEDLTLMRNRVLGRIQNGMRTGSGAERTVQLVKTWNVSTQLGGIVLSSLPDMARPIMAYGLRSYSKGLARGMGTFWKSLDFWGVKKATQSRQIRRMGVAAQRTLNDRMMNMMDLDKPLGKTEAWVQNKWANLSGFNHWTDAMESITAHSAMDWTLRVGRKIHKNKGKVAPEQLLSRSEKMKMARMGFNESDLRLFYEQSLRGPGAKDPDLLYANTLEWEDAALAKKFEAGIGSDVRRAIVRIGMGDKPALMDQAAVSMIAQYQSFAIAATNKMLIAGLQQRDMAMMQGLLASVFLGAIVGGSKTYLRGEDPMKKFTKDPMHAIFEGIDRSGTVGVYNLGFNWLRAFGGDTPSRYMHRGIEGVIGGPTIDKIGRASRVVEGVFEGDAEKVYTHGARMIPLVSNTLHLRQILEQQVQ